ncbi:hypothetical protein BN159_1202 [Streptomyces davaonensis JCM 4913]|uniref:Integral membrane protein n=1 Tax=Streptomyces davaonensis (strain DSM 101723 / JCM 4913 / KCC S-0913 / 768) TaxID=1214101 RepID=K4QT09_STRDJ|nr:DUF308 domain-containing protein [Streptomyces davaonensis]CCK25581.1 hypothetical protein BN159_1202 [Streptomyces davaonensis JCM 4913]
MTQTTVPSRTTTTTTTSSGLRSLYLIRVAFSLIWVALVFATSASLVSADKPTAIAAVLLVVYPLWDAIATLLEQRMTGTGSMDRVGATNVALGIATAAVMTAAVFSTIGAALLVFGIWALLSGAIQLVVAIRRRRTVGAQWPMIISGGLSVLAGASFAAMSASDTSGLSGIAGYSAFGAFWFLVSVVALSVRGRREERLR